MILIDSHCHLNLLKGNLSEILYRAKNNNVHYINTICTSIEEFHEILDIAIKYKNIFVSCGVHPNKINTAITSDIIANYCIHPKVIGIGETGLDYHYVFDRYKQINSFIQHIKVSQNIGLPIIIHTRDAEKDTLEILNTEMRNLKFKGLIHSFTGSKYFAQKVLDLDIYISISGIITFKNASNLVDVVKYIPLNRLLVETDAPYLSPVPMRGQQNEPSFVKYVVKQISEIKKINIEKVSEDVYNNFITLFSKISKNIL